MIFFLLLATLTSGTLVSVLTAALLANATQNKLANQMLSFSVGSLMATAMLGILPHVQMMLNVQRNPFDYELSGAFSNGQIIFAGLMAGFLLWFLLERLSLWRHDHHHEGDGHHHHLGFDRERVGGSGFTILIGGALHNFTDGLLIAAAFLTEIRLGLMTAISIVIHEISHELSDFIVLLNAGFSRQKAIFYNLLSGLSSVIGGVLGYFLLPVVQSGLPYILILAASSFLYVALSDLLPQVKRNQDFKQGMVAFGFLILGVITVVAIEWWHGHG